MSIYISFKFYILFYILLTQWSYTIEIGIFSPGKYSSSLDSSRYDDEHRLIARYAARLAAEARTVVRLFYTSLHYNIELVPSVLLYSFVLYEKDNVVSVFKF